VHEYSYNVYISIYVNTNKEIQIIFESDFGHVGDFMAKTQLTVEFDRFPLQSVYNI